MKLQALGKYIHIEKLGTKTEQTAARFGMVLPPTGPHRSGTETVLKQGKVLSIGRKAQEELPDLKVGDTIYYNPFDQDQADTETIINVAAVAAKVC